MRSQEFFERRDGRAKYESHFVELLRLIAKWIMLEMLELFKGYCCESGHLAMVKTIDLLSGLKNRYGCGAISN